MEKGYFMSFNNRNYNINNLEVLRFNVRRIRETKKNSLLFLTVTSTTISIRTTKLKNVKSSNSSD